MPTGAAQDAVESRRTTADGRSSLRTFLTGTSRPTGRTPQKWLTLPTSGPRKAGLYVAVVLDLFSRRAVGWSMKAERDASLVMDALMMAVWRRGKADALLHHSDQGSQYTSKAVSAASG